MNLVEYYENHDVLASILSSVMSPHLRTWKKIMADGAVRQNKYPISSINQLKSFLLSRGPPVSVYYSVGLFMNPHNVHGNITGRRGYVVADGMFLYSDLFFDFDSEDDLEVARKDAVKTIDFMKTKKSFRLIKIQYSGAKGFHLVYEPVKKFRINDPKKRLRYYHQKRVQLLAQLPNLKTLNDNHIKITLDQFRVYAATNTVKAKTGNKVVILSEEQIRKPYRPERLVEPMTSEDSITTRPSRERPGLISRGTYTYDFVSSVVRGTKGMHIPVLEFRPKTRMQIRFLRTIQFEYNLSDMFFLEDSGGYVAFCLKIVDKRRLEKILKRAKSFNYSKFMRTGHCWIKITPLMTLGGRHIDRLKLVGVLRRDAGGSFSRPHAMLVAKHIRYQNLCGTLECQGGTAYVTVE